MHLTEFRGISIICSERITCAYLQPPTCESSPHNRFLPQRDELAETCARDLKRLEYIFRLPILQAWGLFIFIPSDGMSFQVVRLVGNSHLARPSKGNFIICYICFPNRGIKSHLAQLEERNNAARQCWVCVWVRVQRGKEWKKNLSL